jgi:hypothetical protein
MPKKLNRDQYDELQRQYDNTPDPSESGFPSGQHYFLVAILNKFGWHPSSREEALSLADDLLSQGWLN